MCSYNAQGDGASVKTTDMSTTGTYSHLSSGCGKKYGNVTGAKDLADADFALHHDEIENKFNQGWETWVSQMGGDADACSYNFDAEELAVRLGTRVDKAGKLHAKILLQKIYHFWGCKQHTDMVLVAGPVREEVHLHMFLAHTEFYEKLVMIPNSERLWKEGKLVLDMTGMVTPRSLKTIISFVYTGAVKLTLDNVTDLAMAAKNMGFRRLQQQCTEFLDYIFADFHLFIILRNVPVDHKFFDVAWTKILKRFRHVCNDPNFLLIDANQLELLIASDKLNVDSEYQVFRPVLNWINHDRASRERYFFKLMGQVRFPYMDLDELINCMQEEDLFRTNAEAQKMLEDSDMYATMESMGETWCNYPPWPPRNDVIRMKVAARKEKLRKLRPRTKNEICNSELPCALQTNYGAKFDPTCPDADTLTCNTYCEMRGYGKILPTSCGPEQPQGLQEGEFELFGLTEAPESYRANSQNHSKKVLTDGQQTSSNRTQMLAQLRADKGVRDHDKVATGSVSPGALTKTAMACSLTASTTTFGSKDLAPMRGPSEISLPSCMLKKQNRAP